MRSGKSFSVLLSGCTLIMLLSGCSTSKDEMLPPGDSTMLELWNDGASATHATGESRTTLRRPVTDSERVISQQTRDSYAEHRRTKSSRRFRGCPIQTW